jgi:glycerol transport system ATP-binding protein
VRQNLEFPLKNRHVPQDEISRRVEEMIDVLDLGDKANRKARGLTADEKQKISLGRGLVRYDVNAILFDEPLTVIDPHMKWQLRTKLKDLHRQFNHTMIYVTHDQTEALTFADKVVVMYDGEVVQIGTPEALFDEPKHTFVGYFIGSPGMNIIPVDVVGNQAKIGNHTVDLKGGYPDMTGKIELGIRPEFVSLDKAGSGIPAKVTGVDDIGRFKIVHATVDSNEVNIVLNEGESIPSDPKINFETSRTHIYQNDHLVYPLVNTRGL